MGVQGGQGFGSSGGSTALLQEELIQLARISGPVTSLTFQLGEEVKEKEAQAAAALRASGMLPR